MTVQLVFGLAILAAFVLGFLGAVSLGAWLLTHDRREDEWP